MFLVEDNKINWKSLCVAAAVVAFLCALGIFLLDKPLFVFMRRFDGAFARMLGAFSSFKFLFAISAVVFSITAAVRIWYIRRRAASYDWLRNLNISGLYVLSAVLVSGVITGCLKIFFGRARPVLWEIFGQTGFYPFHSEWVFNSMPSGHAAAAFAAMATVGILFKRYKIPVWIAAALFGLSRIAAGAHWPSDVILGAFIGIVSAEFIRAAFARLSRRRA
ncbi:MAG: phosphatase PAP2 family protein [Alphaproteobacteria bacterium]|nr:phosphatase PAP2 family protein [Alphaproteobacteria bacterium]